MIKLTSPLCKLYQKNWYTKDLVRLGVNHEFCITQYYLLFLKIKDLYLYLAKLSWYRNENNYFKNLECHVLLVAYNVDFNELCTLYQFVKRYATIFPTTK